MPLEMIKHCCQKSIRKKCFLTQADILGSVCLFVCVPVSVRERSLRRKLSPGCFRRAQPGTKLSLQQAQLAGSGRAAGAPCILVVRSLVIHHPSTMSARDAACGLQEWWSAWPYYQPKHEHASLQSDDWLHGRNRNIDVSIECFTGPTGVQMNPVFIGRRLPIFPRRR